MCLPVANPVWARAQYVDCPPGVSYARINECVKKKDATIMTYTERLAPVGLTIRTPDPPVHMNNSQNPVDEPGTQF